MRFLPWLALASIVLSGCAGGAPASVSSSSASATAEPAMATPDTGGIEGVVVDDEQSPISNAEVGVSNAANTARTAQDGSYSFSGLEPGEYLVSVGALGYEAAGRKVMVVAGEVAKVDFVLKPIVLDEGPLIDVVPRRGFINCSVNPYYSANVCANAMQDQAHFPFSFREGLAVKELSVELVFKPAQGAFGQRMELNVCDVLENQTNQVNCATSDYYSWASGTSPIHLRMTDVPKTTQSLQATVGAGQFDADAPEVPLVFQQSFDLYISVCYLEKCPEDFQARPAQ